MFLFISHTHTQLAPPQITATTSTPQYFLVGTSFTLDCTFSGPPNTFLNWYLNNTLLSSSTDQQVQILSNGSLAIANPTTSYSGVYTCNVSTSATFITAQISLTVGGMQVFVCVHVEYYVYVY